VSIQAPVAGLGLELGKLKAKIYLLMLKIAQYSTQQLLQRPQHFDKAVRQTQHCIPSKEQQHHTT
jgi:hypothetical protein